MPLGDYTFSFPIDSLHLSPLCLRGFLPPHSLLRLHFLMVNLVKLCYILESLGSLF